MRGLEERGEEEAADGFVLRVVVGGEAALRAREAGAYGVGRGRLAGRPGSRPRARKGRKEAWSLRRFVRAEGKEQASVAAHVVFGVRWGFVRQENLDDIGPRGGDGRVKGRETTLRESGTFRSEWS